MAPLRLLPALLRIPSLARRLIPFTPLILWLLLGPAPTRLAAQPADTPVPLAPIDGARATDEFPTLRWAPTPRAAEYLVQLSRHPTDFTTPHLVEEASTPDTAFTLSATLDANRAYYWRLRARGPSGSSPWSDAARFSTGRLLYPREGALIALPDTLRWRPGDDPMQHGFTLQIAENDAFDDPIVSIITDETAFALSEPPLEAGRRYAWRLGTVGVVMHWTPTRSFTVGQSGPDAPLLTHPDDGAVGLTQPITLRCRTARGAPPADGFFFEVARDAAFDEVVFTADADGPEGQARVAGLAPGRRYYWRARAFVHRAEGKQAGPWSPARRFTTLALPAAPHLKSPAPGAEGLTVAPTLAWFEAPRAARYVLEIARALDDLERRPLVRVGEDPARPLTETAFTLPLAEALLDFGAAYVWRVRALGAAGPGPWSSAWRFSTGDGPEGPEPRSPADASTSLDVPLPLAWRPPPGAPAVAFYTLDVSADSAFSGYARYYTQQASFELTRAPGRVWHFWRVRAHFADGSYTAWSEARRFRTRPEAPPTLAPAHDARMVPLPVSLRWQAPEEPARYGAAFHYRVEVFAGSDLASPVLSVEPVEEPRLRLDASALSYGQCYHWRVKVVSRDAEAEEPSSLWSRLRTACFDRYPAPVRLWPRDGEVVWTQRPSLLWQALGPEDLPAPFGVLPTHYDVQVGRGPDLDDPSRVVFEGSVAAPDAEAPPGSVGYLVPGALAADADYWWRLRARHRDDGVGAWNAAPWRFHTLPVVGSPPVLLSPSDGAEGVSRQPVLRWLAAPGAVRHVVVVFEQGAVVWQRDLFTQGQTGVLAQQVEIPLAYERAYTWQVQAYSPTSSAWSSEWGFTTAAEALPAAVHLLAPEAGAVGVLPPVALVWEAVSGASGYRVQVVADSADFSMGPYVVDEAVSATSSASQAYEVGLLEAGSRYYWRVCAENTSGRCGAWSAARWFVTAGPVALSAPVLLAPVGGAAVSLQPVFVWTEVSGAAHYEWQLGAGSEVDDPMAVRLLSGTQYVHEHTLLPGQRYSWRVRALDALGRTGPWSQPGSFVTQTGGVPPAPHLEAPADGTSDHPQTVVLMWVPVTGASYHVQVARDEPDFTTPLAEATGLEEVFYVVSGLSEGRWYYWRVRACVEGTCSAWSSVWRWRVGEEGPASSSRVRRYYYVRDHLGSVRATVDEAGVVVHHDDYYPFGARMPGRSYIAGEPTKENFTGHELDDETGLIYALGRYYDPVIASWPVVDPLADDYPGVSPYAYVLNNPVNLVDPTGEYPTCGEKSDCDDIYQEGSIVSNRFGEFTYRGNNQWEIVKIGGASLRGVNVSAEQLASYTMTPVQDEGTISQWNPGFLDRWSESDNLLASVGYGSIDAPWVAFQTMNPFDSTPTHVNGALATPREQLDAGVASAPIGYGAAKIGRAARAGREIAFGRNFRIAPFGNRTGHPIGRYPHYHRRGSRLPNGHTVDGQGIKRHRPWEKKSTDKSFWDRF